MVMQGKMAGGTVLTQASVIQAHFLPAACQPTFHVRKKFSPKIKRLKTGDALGSEWGVCFLDYWITILNSGNCIPKVKHHKKRKAGPRSQCLAVLADRSNHGGAGDVGSNPRTSIIWLWTYCREKFCFNENKLKLKHMHIPLSRVIITIKQVG